MNENCRDADKMLDRESVKEDEDPFRGCQSDLSG